MSEVGFGSHVGTAETRPLSNGGRFLHAAASCAGDGGWMKASRCAFYSVAEREFAGSSTCTAVAAAATCPDWLQSGSADYSPFDA